MALFLSLYLGHVLGDFVFQPGSLVVAKRQGTRGVVLHAAIVCACTAAAGAANLPVTWPVVLIAAAAHAATEYLTIGARRTGRASGLTVFLLDQGVHIVTLVLLVLLFPRPVPPVLLIFSVPLETLAAVCGVATVAFAGSILVFEAQIAQRPRTPEASDPILAMDASRLYGMAERAAGLVIALAAPLPVLGTVAFAPRLVCAALQRDGQRASHLVAAATGAGLCALVWLLVTVPLTTR